tara:strand:- start:1758 stop:2453 length:696 start_codon:yes stop_codon:yes gene_type:complete
MDKYTLIALDIIDGLDENFYVVDINGLIGINSILKYKKEFDDSLHSIFNEKVNIECSDFIKNSNKIKKKTNSNITISNTGFQYEDKLKWRERFDIPCPKINNEIIIHSNPDFPKYLSKPKFSFKGRGIDLYNDNNLSNTTNFLEEFIPSKTIDGYCYSIRVIMVINEKESHPILFLNRKCSEPIIKNLEIGKLKDGDKLSYISNLSDAFDYEINTDSRLKEFISNLKIYSI